MGTGGGFAFLIAGPSYERKETLTSTLEFSLLHKNGFFNSCGETGFCVCMHMCVTKGNWKTLIIYEQVEKTLGLPEIVSKGREGISPPSESDQQIKLLYDYALSNDFCSV